MITSVIDKWHAYLRGQLPGGLDGLLDDDVVFYSPIVYTPQEGKAITALYLQAAGMTLPGAQTASTSGGSGTSTKGFRYTKEILGEDTAVLELRQQSRASTSTESTSSAVTTRGASSSSA